MGSSAPNLQIFCILAAIRFLNLFSQIRLLFFLFRSSVFQTFQTLLIRSYLYDKIIFVLNISILPTPSVNGRRLLSARLNSHHTLITLLISTLLMVLGSITVLSLRYPRRITFCPYDLKILYRSILHLRSFPLLCRDRRCYKIRREIILIFLTEHPACLLYDIHYFLCLRYILLL